ncbi:MAG: phosphoglucosamine mutase [Caldiserica bacterium]|jgi:phosphoglucosamine mutase|nr:phosphoglucosamine mutase [Caldisericota bacterium]MDH7562503.1 phosphoglucosamine mutase [Caldisericota bacterium]
MNRKIFGTDGVRGAANIELTADLALKIGRALGFYLKEKYSQPLIIIGKDPRISSDMLEAALASGALSAGVKVGLLGIVTTPALSVLVKDYGAQAGVMISASHNPIQDNGIKIFGENSMKLSDAEEARIEEILEGLSFKGPDFPERPLVLPDSRERYLSFLRRFSPRSIKPLKLVLDCAWGSTSLFAPQIFKEAGLEVFPLNSSPDGSQINVGCGSTNIDFLRGEVLKRKADLGFAFDGDGDRLIAVDRNGRVVDGDVVLCIFGLHRLKEGTLPKRTVVTTVMSNFALEKAIQENGGRLIRTKVGDRYVLEKMIEEGAVLGGEQSGHIIFGEISWAGDGMLTGLLLLQLIQETGKDLSELGHEYQPVPQVLLNVKVKDKGKFSQDVEIQRALEKFQKDLEGRGRVVVRPSGTEPIIRVMVESLKEGEAEEVAYSLSSLIKDRLSL